MKKPKKNPGQRAGRTHRKAGDPDHHLVANRGFWWVCCSINATPRTKEKLGYSLGTKCLLTARLRRDMFLNGLHARGLEVRIRRHSGVNLVAVAPLNQHAAVPWQARVEQVVAAARAAALEGEEAPPMDPKPRRRRAVCVA